jgi:tetratricopeptide (TPR) repeat protein
LRQANHTDAAIKGFHTAIELNDKNWIAMGRLSFCYESLQLYELAVEWSRKALEICPTVGHRWDRAQYWQTIASCLLDLGDIEGAKVAAKEASNLKPENGDILSTYIFILDSAGDHSELMSYLEDLRSKTSEETDENLLTTALMANDYLLEVLGYAARAVGKLDFLIKAQETTIEAANRDEDFEEIAIQQNLLAELYYTQVNDQKKAVELWELVLKSKGASAEAIQSASDFLSMVYYAEAIAAETQKGKGPRQWITKLQKLAKYDHDTHEASLSDAALMLATWYREHGNINEARYCSRASVLHALDMLSDDDPYNDSSAWLALSTSLLKAGDRVNAMAAYAIVVQEFDNIKAAIAKRKPKTPEISETILTNTGNETSSDALSPAMTALNINSPPITTPLRPAIPGAAHPRSYISSTLTSSSTSTPEATTSDWFCDGQCRRGVESWKELHICEICPSSICFCEQCIVLVKEGKLEFRVCDPNHKWYQAYPIREGWGMVAGDTASEGVSGMILVDGRAVELDVWLKGLREEWTKGGSEG